MTVQLKKGLFVGLCIAFGAQLWWIDHLRSDPPGVSNQAGSASQPQQPRPPEVITFPRYLTDPFTGRQVDTASLLANEAKVLNLLNTRCIRCIERLATWAPFVNEYAREEDLAILFIIHGPTRKYVHALLRRFEQTHMPVLYDSTGFIEQENSLANLTATLLLDKDNNVVMTGYPLRDSTTAHTFEAELHRLLASPR